MSVVHVSTMQELQSKVSGHSGIVILDVFASWCGPCQALKPILESYATSAPSDVLVLSVDSDEVPEAVSALGVRAFPTLIAFFNGEARAQHMGLTDARGLEALASQARG